MKLNLTLWWGEGGGGYRAIPLRGGGGMDIFWN